GVGIQERDELASSHDELIDRVLTLLEDVARVDYQQHLDIVGGAPRAQFYFSHLEAALQLLDQHPRLRRLLLEDRRERLPPHREGAHYPHAPRSWGASP